MTGVTGCHLTPRAQVLGAPSGKVHPRPQPRAAVRAEPPKAALVPAWTPSHRLATIWLHRAETLAGSMPEFYEEGLWTSAGALGAKG